MTVRAGRHRLTGMVSLGTFHDDMKKIESGKFIKNLKNSYTRLLLYQIYKNSYTRYNGYSKLII